MGIVDVDFHQFWVMTAPDDDSPVLGPTGRLLFHPRRSHVSVLSGIATGPVQVSTERLSGPPAEVADGWEDVAEASLTVDDEPLGVCGWTMELPLDERWLGTKPGTYRVRVHANGRDTAYDAVVFEPVEQFLVQAWPAPYEPPTDVRATSRVGRGLV